MEGVAQHTWGENYDFQGKNFDCQINIKFMVLQ